MAPFDRAHVGLHAVHTGFGVGVHAAEFFKGSVHAVHAGFGVGVHTAEFFKGSFEALVGLLLPFCEVVEFGRQFQEVFAQKAGAHGVAPSGVVVEGLEKIVQGVDGCHTCLRCKVYLIVAQGNGRYKS